MACRIERKREISPISSAQVSAVIRPTQGIVCSRRTLSANSGSRCSDRISADSMRCSRVIESRLSRRSGRILLSIAPCWPAARGNTLLGAGAACCSSLRFPSASLIHDSSAAPLAVPGDGDTAAFASSRESPSMPCSTPAGSRSVGSPRACGIDLIVLLLGCGDRPQHQRMRYLHCCCVRLQMIVDPAAEDRRFHGSRPRLRKCLQPGVQLPARRANLALLVNLTAGILYAIGSSSCADPVRCNTYVLEEPPWLFSESASPLVQHFVHHVLL